jgi:hypothetical protein
MVLDLIWKRRNYRGHSFIDGDQRGIGRINNVLDDSPQTIEWAGELRE